MFKKLWGYLTDVDYDTREQIVGLRYLMGFGLAVLLLPLLYPIFVPEQTKENKDAELDSLKLVYVQRIDSLSKVFPEKYAKENSKSVYEDKIGYDTYSKKTAYSYYEEERKISGESEKSTAAYIPKEIHKFNLNTASKEDLKEVSGIGDVFADRIIKYRESLGGFYSSIQLNEVYGIDSNVLSNSQKHLIGNLTPNKYLKINSDEFKIILKHPYLEYEEVKLIFKNRPIGSKEALCRILPDKCEKLAHYIILDK